MVERTLNFGSSEADARYQIRDTGDGADLLIRDTQAGEDIARYDATAGTWDYQSISTDDATVKKSITDPAGVTHTGELADIDDVGGGDSTKYIWVTGGQDRTDNYPGRTFVINTSTGAVRELPPMPTPRQAGAAFVHNREFYYIGGRDLNDSVSAKVEAYDMDAGSWTTKTPMPTARSRLSHEAVNINDKFHIVCGHDGTNRLATHEVYDPAADSWDTTKADAPSTHSFPLQAHHNGYLWLITGGSDAGTEGLIQRYDVSADTWDGPSNFTAHPHNVTDGGGKPAGDTFIAFGGWDASSRSGDSVRRDEIYEYEYATDTWTQVGTMPQVWTHGAILHDSDSGRFYRVGGDKFPNPGPAAHPEARTGEAIAMDAGSDDATTAARLPVRLQNFGAVLSSEAPGAGAYPVDSPIDTMFSAESSGVINGLGGDTGQASVVTTDYVHDGGGALKVTTTGSLTSVYDTGEHPETRRGVPISVWFNAVTAKFANVMIHAQPGSETTDYYQVSVNPPGERMVLSECDAGTEATIADSNTGAFTASLDTWYRLDVFPEPNGDLTATLNDTDGDSEIYTITGTPTAMYKRGRVGFQCNSDASGEYAVFDSVTRQ